MNYKQKFMKGFMMFYTLVSIINTIITGIFTGNFGVNDYNASIIDMVSYTFWYNYYWNFSEIIAVCLIAIVFIQVAYVVANKIMEVYHFVKTRKENVKSLED